MESKNSLYFKKLSPSVISHETQDCRTFSAENGLAFKLPTNLFGIKIPKLLQNEFRTSF